MAETPGPTITVRLMGKIAEFGMPSKSAKSPYHDIQVTLPADLKETTPLEIINLIAKQNPLLRDQIVRDDGTPRSSTRILLNGSPPNSISQPLTIVHPTGGQEEVIIIIRGKIGPITIIVIVVLPCDG